MAKAFIGSAGLGSSTVTFEDDAHLTEFLVDLHVAFQSDRQGAWVEVGRPASGEESDGYRLQWVPKSTPVAFVFDADIPEDADIRASLGML